MNTSDKISVRYIGEKSLVTLKVPYKIKDGKHSIERAIEDAAKSQKKEFTIDMGNMTILNSSEVGLLAHFYKKTNENGIKLSLINLKGYALNIIKNNKLDTIIKIYENASKYRTDGKTGKTGDLSIDDVLSGMI
jgi:anti-anti-sigma factor